MKKTIALFALVTIAVPMFAMDNQQNSKIGIIITGINTGGKPTGMQSRKQEPIDSGDYIDRLNALMDEAEGKNYKDEKESKNPDEHSYVAGLNKLIDATNNLNAILEQHDLPH